MKKLMILAAAFVLNAATAWAESTPVFNETGAFVIARSVKLGETNISVAPKTAGTAQKTCPPGIRPVPAWRSALRIPIVRKTNTVLP